MGVRTVGFEAVDCGSDHTPGGVPCPGHEVVVEHYHSSDTYTLEVDGEDLILTEPVFLALRDAMNAVTQS